jgi:tetratricopeptide (TPR) repeat protein
LIVRIRIFTCFTLAILIISNDLIGQSQNNNSLDEAKFSSVLIQGISAKISGDFYTADSLLKVGIQLNPKSGVCYFELSGISWAEDDKYLAIEQAQKAVQFSPKNEWYLANLAVFYKKINNYQSAGICFEKLFDKHPERIEYLFSLAECQMENKSYKKALKTFDEIELTNGISQDLSLQKHQLLVFLKKRKKAINELKQLIKSQPDDIRNYGILGEFYQSIGKEEEAFKVFQNMMAMDSSNGLVRLSLFQYYYRSRQHDLAVKELLAVMNSHEITEDVKLEILLQISYEKNSSFKISELELFLNNFLTFHKKNSNAFLLFADIKFLQNKNDSACIYLRKSLFIDPFPFEVWSQLMTTELASNNYQKVVKDAGNAIINHPNQPLSYIILGVAQAAVKNYEESLKSLTTGVSFVVDDSLLTSDFEHHIGDAYYQLEDFESAFLHLQKAVNNNPNNPVLLNNYSYYLSEQGKDLDLAEQLILKALKYYPDNATFLDTYGWVLFIKEDYNKAEIWINKAINNSSEENGAILEHYGDVLFHLEKKEEAFIFWEKAKKMDGVSDKIQTKINEKKFIK